MFFAPSLGRTREGRSESGRYTALLGVFLDEIGGDSVDLFLAGDDGPFQLTPAMS